LSANQILFLTTVLYSTQFRAPWDHSWYRPIKRIKIKKILTLIQIIKFEEGNTTIIGNSNAISTSKIKKITAIKKKRKENGNRAELFGSNPHSKGEHFSRSSVIFFDKIEAKIITIIDNIRIKIDIIDINIIIYTKID
jgi:hypothetical protein